MLFILGLQHQLVVNLPVAVNLEYTVYSSRHFVNTSRRSAGNKIL